MKVFYLLFLFGLVVIGNSAFVARLSFQEELQMLKDVSLGAMGIFTSLLALLGTALLIPKDVEERTIYTVLAKPVPRYEYLLGKLFGVMLVILAALVVMSVVFVAVLGWRQHTLALEAAAAVPAEDTATAALAVAQVKQAGLNWNLAQGIAMVYVKACVVAAFTLLLSSFASSSIFAIFTGAAVYFIGHLQATARGFWMSGHHGSWWGDVLAGAVAILFPDLQAFSITDQIVAGVTVPPDLFVRTAALGGLYVALYYLGAVFAFGGREL